MILFCGIILLPLASAKHNFVLFDYYNMAQSGVSATIKKYPRMRDIHGPDAEFFIPNVVVANTIAKAVNATLLSNYQIFDPDILKESPSISPALQIFDVYNRTVQYIWARYRNKVVSLPSKVHTMPNFVQIRPLHFQFAYCDDVRKKTDSIWNFSVFTNCFDSLTWLAIGCVFICVSFVQFASVRVVLKNMPIKVENILFTTLSPVISPSVVGNAYISECPGTFTLWLFVCVVLLNYYTGLLTSLIISPPPPDTMSEIEDLQLRNYSLISGWPNLLGALNSTISSHFLGSSSFVQNDISVLKTLLEHVQVFEEPEFYKALAFSSDKVATVMGWPFALYAAATANSLLDKNMPLNKRRCFVGKELVHSGAYYYGFLPPGDHLRLRDMCIKLVEAGIFDIWADELFGLAYSPARVQDRLRVKSPTNIVEENDEVVALKMQGKIVTIFLVWMFCILVAVIAFTRELLHLNRNVTKVIK